MKENKFKVYFNDDVNCPVIVFEADTLAECKNWIEEDLKGKTPVNDEFPCTEDVMRSSRTFSYEVYEGEITGEEDGESIYEDFCYTCDYYYTN